MPRKILAALFAFVVLAFGTVACDADVNVPEGEGEGGVQIEGEEGGD